MQWLIFGDDWGRHPSTTQHLIRSLPQHDDVVWINSIGMRAPSFTRADAHRILSRIRPGRAPKVAASTQQPRVVLSPRLLPWHHRFARFNKRHLASQILQHGHGPWNVITANPVVVLYLDQLPLAHVTYLRLDDYERLPGVDANLIGALEPQMIERADLVAYTARALRPEGLEDARALYLPQGVDLHHFQTCDPEPTEPRVLGFFGLMAEWLDFELIERVARQRPDWTLEFLGPARVQPPRLMDLPNIRMRPAVDYADLPRSISHWSAAWIPFERSRLTSAVNPLKLREYLAAGLPAASTSLPEVISSDLEVTIVTNANDVSRWLQSVAHELPTHRTMRQNSMIPHGWNRRAQTLRQRIQRGIA